MTDNKNWILAITLSLAVLFAWQVFVVNPRIERDRARQPTVEQNQRPGAPAPATPQAPQAPATPQTAAPGVPAPGTPATAPAVPGAPAALPREAVVGATPRVPVETADLRGSINLKGGRIDDLALKNYRETVDPHSPNIVLLAPSGSPHPYYAEFGWVAPAGSNIAVPGPDTVWTAEGQRLTPQGPVTLTWDNGQGLVFRRTISVDNEYMFAVRQEVENRTGAAVTLYPYALVSRHGTPETAGFYILHEGLIGVLGEQGLQEITYSTVSEKRAIPYSATGGWLGITDKYWATALIPPQDAAFQGHFRAGQAGTTNTYQSDYLLPAVTVAPGAKADTTGRLFAGAKEVSTVDHYQKALGIKNFDLLIDWGWFYFITKPLFSLIDAIFRMVGNFGVAILIVTVLVKLVFFPLAYKSYVSMSKMKKVQPEMQKIRERFPEDRVKQQQALMELYKREKINPLSGCLPILIQIPVFFALYKVLFVTIEMRHAPFFGWIRDLSAPDPTSLFNLFGLIPWQAPELLMLGIWPIIMGITMWVQMRLNPTPPDPVQQTIFNWMPVIFTFMLASFPAGLVIYWAWNNLLSIVQQWVIMRRQGVPVELWGNVKSSFARAPRKQEGPG